MKMRTDLFVVIISLFAISCGNEKDESARQAWSSAHSYFVEALSDEMRTLKLHPLTTDSVLNGIQLIHELQLPLIETRFYLFESRLIQPSHRVLVSLSKSNVIILKPQFDSLKLIGNNIFGFVNERLHQGRILTASELEKIVNFLLFTTYLNEQYIVVLEDWRGIEVLDSSQISERLRQTIQPKQVTISEGLITESFYVWDRLSAGVYHIRISHDGRNLTWQSQSLGKWGESSIEI